MVIPDGICPVNRFTIKTMVKKARPPQSIPIPAQLEQRKVELASAEGAAVAHARPSGDTSTLVGRLLRHEASAASGVLKSMGKEAFMASASIAASALQAATAESTAVAPAPPVVKARPAPAQPKAARAVPSTQPFVAAAPVSAALLRAHKQKRRMSFQQPHSNSIPQKQ